VGVDVVRSAKGAAIRTVLRTVDESDSEILAELEHGAACVQEILVDSNAREVPVSALAPPAYSVVGAILRGDRTIIPGGQDTIRADDHLFVFCAREDQEAILEYFERPTPAAPDA
jgi:trk system potassium uptake protein TrkA